MLTILRRMLQLLSIDERLVMLSKSTAIIELHEAIAFSAAAVNIPIIPRSRRITWSTDIASAKMTTSRHTCTYAV